MSRYRFVAEQRNVYPVRRLCAVLRVSASGFYDWLKRTPSRRPQANAALSARIRQVHERSRQTYGYLRMHAELRTQHARGAGRQASGSTPDGTDGVSDQRTPPFQGDHPAR